MQGSMKEGRKRRRELTRRPTTLEGSLLKMLNPALTCAPAQLTTFHSCLTREAGDKGRRPGTTKQGPFL
jgi:hypothetical protein